MNKEITPFFLLKIVQWQLKSMNAAIEMSCMKYSKVNWSTGAKLQKNILKPLFFQP